MKSPTEVGTGKAKDEKAPLSEIIEVLNERFGTEFTEEDRLFFQQIKERASKNEQVIQTALANPLDKFELGIRKLVEDFMIERMGENDKIVTRYMADRDFQAAAYPVLGTRVPALAVCFVNEDVAKNTGDLGVRAFRFAQDNDRLARSSQKRNARSALLPSAFQALLSK